MGNFKIDAIFFDFDGVFTDNKVWISSSGDEFVACSKSDSLGLDDFRKFLFQEKLQLRLALISKETNGVVVARAKKLNLECFTGIDNKADFIQNSCNVLPKEYIYFGNDTNDIEAMQNAAHSLAPRDAHPATAHAASFIGKHDGGNGFVREGLEYIKHLIMKGSG